MALRRTEAPTEVPVTVAEAKANSNITGTSQDDEIEAMIASATEQLDGKDGILGRALCTQEWELLLDAFPCGSEIKVPLPPLQSVESITYVDANGDTQTLATSVYAVDVASEPGVVSLKYGQVWPTTQTQRNAVTIAFTCGYGEAGDVPERIKSAIKLMVGDLFENREAQQTVKLENNPSLNRLLFPFRVFA
jgi:uncharacterized phiE125 gp8 family phage protein